MALFSGAAMGSTTGPPGIGLHAEPPLRAERSVQKGKSSDNEVRCKQKQRLAGRRSPFNKVKFNGWTGMNQGTPDGAPSPLQRG